MIHGNSTILKMEEMMSKEIKKIGKHRGAENFPQNSFLEEEIKEKYQYPQIKSSSKQKDQLIYMLSMGFGKDVIDKIMDENFCTMDLDFIRIIFFITHDMDFIDEQIFNARSIVYEDILDDALEYAIEKKHPEYREITEKTAELQHQQEMLKLRADFIDTQNSYLLKEINARREEKLLRAEIADLKLGASDEERQKLEEEISRLKAVIEELRQNLKESETKRRVSESNLEEVKIQLEKAEQQIQPTSLPDEKNTIKNVTEKAAEEVHEYSEEAGQITEPDILKEILDTITSARDDIKNEIGTAKAEIISAYQEEKQDDEPVEEKQGIHEELQQITEKLTEIAADLKRLSVSLEERDSILNKTNGGLCSVLSNVEVLTTNSDRICRTLGRIENSMKAVRAALASNKQKRKSGLFSLFSESDEEEDICRSEEGTGEEVASVRKNEPVYSYEQMVLKLISNPNLSQEQYKMLLYCIEQKLPEKDFSKIAKVLDKQGNKKIDTIRLETAIRFYFAQNNMLYGYERETGNQNGNTDKPETEAEKYNGQSEDSAHEPVLEGQVNNSPPVSASMVFDAVDDDNSDM